MDRTRESLLTLAKEEFGLNEPSVIKLLKKHHAPTPFDPMAWNTYMTIITGYPGCEYCGGRQKPKSHFLFGSMFTCIADPSHSFASWVANSIVKVQGIDRSTALALAAGQPCSHGIPLAFCHNGCVEKLVQVKTEAL